MIGIDPMTFHLNSERSTMNVNQKKIQCIEFSIQTVLLSYTGKRTNKTFRLADLDPRDLWLLGSCHLLPIPSHEGAARFYGVQPRFIDSAFTAPYESKRKNNFKMVGRVGLEPTTNGLKGHCSTTELPPRYLFTLALFPLASTSFSKNLEVCRTYHHLA